MSCKNIKDQMKSTKNYLKSQKVNFTSDDLVEELDNLSEEHTGNRYGGGNDTGWHTRIKNIADEVMQEDD